MAPARAEAIQRMNRCGLSLSCYGLGGRSSGAALEVRAARLADVDAALEERAVLDRDACRDDVAGERAFAANVHAIARLAVAAYLAQHNDLAGNDVRRDLAITANRHAVARQIDGAFDLSIDVQRLRNRQLSLDDERFANRRLLARGHSRGWGRAAYTRLPRGAGLVVRACCRSRAHWFGS